MMKEVQESSLKCRWDGEKTSGKYGNLLTHPSLHKPHMAKSKATLQVPETNQRNLIQHNDGGGPGEQYKMPLGCNRGLWQIWQPSPHPSLQGPFFEKSEATLKVPETNQQISTLHSDGRGPREQYKMPLGCNRDLWQIWHILPHPSLQGPFLGRNRRPRSKFQRRIRKLRPSSVMEEVQESNIRCRYNGIETSGKYGTF